MSGSRVLPIPRRLRNAGTATGLIVVPSTASFLTPLALCFRHFLLIYQVESIHERASRLLLRVVHVVLVG